MTRRTLPALAAILVLLALAAGAGFWAVTAGSGEEVRTEPVDGGGPGTAATSGPRRRADRTGDPAATRDATRGPGSQGESPDTAPTPARGDWYADLAARLAAGTLGERDAQAILAKAGEGKRPGGGLHEVLRRAAAARDAADEPAARVSAERILQWAVERAQEPYRQDRALFARVYRDVRFGAGDLSAPGGSPVRELRFDEAAKRMRDLRPSLRTWCYDDLALRAAWRFGLGHTVWRWIAWQKDRTSGTPLSADAMDAAFREFQSAAKTTHPATMFDLHLRPLLEGLDPGVGILLASAFADAGEPAIAADMLKRSRAAPGRVGSPADPLASWDRLLGLDSEIEALRDLRGVAGATVPGDAAAKAGVDSWFGRHRRTLVAHAIGGDGPVESGTWDDDMTASWLAGGLPWAPEQWIEARTWTVGVRTEDRDGVRGHVVRSPRWEVFTDVSPEFAGDAALVLEAAFGQACAYLRFQDSVNDRIGARIYARRADYRAITHDDSGGHWVPGMNAVLTFLDDPSHTDFEQFRYPTLVHEATHAALAHGAVPHPPAWLHEGLACFVARWDPTRSVAANASTTRGWMSRRLALQRASDAGILPSLDELFAITRDWAVDDFGPQTSARYAVAEALVVHVDAMEAETPPPFPHLMARWLAAVGVGRAPAAAMSATERAALDKSWAQALDQALTPGR